MYESEKKVHKQQSGIIYVTQCIHNTQSATLAYCYISPETGYLS